MNSEVFIHRVTKQLFKENPLEVVKNPMPDKQNINSINDKNEHGIKEDEEENEAEEVSSNKDDV